jgi:hypothetical protein
MKRILLLLISLSSTIIYSQTDSEIKQIVKNYDFEAIKKLETKFKESSKNSEQGINAFLSENKTAKRVIKDTNKNYYLDDVIDGIPIYIATDNVDSAKATRTNFLHSNGGLGLNLEGQGMLIGIWDEGAARPTHYEFRESATSTVSRVSTPDYVSGNYNSHGTHVAGTLIGRGFQADAKGMAPQANLVSYDFNNDYLEVLNQANFGGLLISNHSYGTPVNLENGEQNAPSWMMGCYDSQARDWDEIAYSNPYYLHVVSAGNDGQSNYSGGLLGGYDKLNREKNSKNNLVIANANNPLALGSGNIISLSINSSSSQGPSDDGRIKPDITGDGTQLYSAESSNNLAYGVKTGTSMAAPNVAGSLILLQQYYNQLNSTFMRSATLKGLVCHTATDDGTRVGPDPIFGWGLLNSKFTAETILEASLGNAIVYEGAISDGESYSVTLNVSSGSPLIATLCWTDPAGTARSGSLNNPTPALVNDLDLRVVSPENTVYYPWKLNLSDISGTAETGDNLVDTVEKIDIDTPVSGIYTLNVNHKGSLTNSTQEFSLIITAENLVLSSEDSVISEIKIWPNPAKEVINYQFNAAADSPYLVQLTDLQGRKVYAQNLIGTSALIKGAINTSNLSKGVYFLSLSQGNKSTHKKVVVQ